MQEHTRFQEALLRRAAEGKLEARAVARVLAPQPSADGPGDVAALLDWLEGLGTPEAEVLADGLCPERCAEIRRLPADAVLPGLPPDAVRRFFADEGLTETLNAALAGQLDRIALDSRGVGGAAAAKLREQEAAWQAKLAANPAVWERILPPRALAELVLSDSGCWERWSTEEQERLGRFAAQLPGAAEPAARTAADWRFRLRGCTSRADARKLVDELCLWPTRELAELLPAVLEEPWQRRRAMQILAWRFGRGDTDTWEGLSRWLAEQSERWRQIRGELATLQLARAGELLLLWCDGREDVPRDILELLRKPYAGVVAKNRLHGLRFRYAALLSAEDMAKLDYVVPTAVFAQPPAETPPASVPVLRVKPQPVPAAPPEPAQPATPTLWQQHLRPFLTENWLLVAGILGVLAGVSVLVYRYWQSTWLIRYTVVQGLLLAGTILPDRLGVWLEKRDAKLRDTAMTLTGATVLLVPLNVLCPIMLVGGEGGLGRLLASLLGVGLLLGFGWWLQGVLARSVPGFGRRFGLALSAMHGAGFGTLLLMSLLGCVPTFLGILPYLLFAACAVMVWTVPKTVASRQAKVFFGVTLAGTFLQLLAWGHLLAKAPFAGAVWAPLTVLIGGLGLLADCRFGEATEEERAIPGRIAFAGFAVVLLGLLLSLAHPWLRPLVFLLAGQIWLRYGLGRPHPAHAWIGISLTALGVLAVAYVPSWPTVWRPVVPLFAAIVLEPTFWRRRDHAFSRCLHEALAGVQSVFAGMAVVAAVLSQLHYRSEPRIALLVVALATGLFAWFARRERNSRWVRAAAIVAVVALPYAGFADTLGNFWKANTMAFGLGLLAWLWIGLVQWRRQVDYLRASRSTVLVLYGGFAMTAMSVRLLLQRLEPEAGLVWYWMDLMGPVLMLGALVLATWWSRSLLPAGMAAVVGAIFAPAMKEFLIQVFPWIVWRSGLGSSLWALGLIGLCFRLRDEARLRDLGPGDGWWETSRFPWIRTDHTLFTLPAFLTALFLCVRVDAYIWLWRLSHSLMVWRTCLALSLTGVAWLAAAVYLERVNKSWQRWCAYLGCFWLGFGAALASWVLRSEGWDSGALWFCLSVQAVHALGILIAVKRWEWGRAVMVEPARWTLLVVSVGLASGLLAWLSLFDGLASVPYLAAFCTAQLVWHGWWTRRHFFGWLLLGLLLVMAASAELGGNTGLVDVVGWHQILRYPLATLILLLGLAVVAERWWGQVFSRGEALLTPLLLGSGGLAVAGGLGMVFQVLLPSEFDMVHFWLAAVFVLLAARANGWTFPVLCAVIAGGILLASPGFPRDYFPALLAVVAEPWKLGFFACILVACAHGGAWVYRRWPKWMVSPQARYPLPSARPFVAAGVFVASWGVLRHLRVTEHRDAAGQLAAPFLSALALLGAAVMPKAEQVVPLLASAWAFVVVGCVLAMRVCAGPWVRSLGGGEVHLIALGLAAAVLLAESAAAWRRRSFAVTMGWAGTAPAAFILVALVLGYLSHPGLEHTNSARCLISACCALVATFSFRRLRDEQETNPLAAIFPFSLALAVMALSMAIPWLRQADWALAALYLPALALLVLADLRKCRIEIEVAFWAICAPLPLLLVPQFYHLLCCPGTDLWVAHFHRHALVPLLAGLLMVRLAVRHRQAVAACFGGPLLALGCYAVVARWPLAWCFAPVVLPRTVWLLACAHLWLGLTASPAVRHRLIGELDGASVREFWQGFACAVSQFAVLGVVVYGGLSSYASAPLLAGAASVLIHARAAGAAHWLTRVALVETVIAIHLDFLTPSYLPRNLVIWVLLGCWAALLLADGWWKGRLRNQAAAGSQALALLVFFHIWQRWPGSLAGLVGMVLGAGLYAWSPLPANAKDEQKGELAASLFLVPAWLAFWWSAGPTIRGLDLNMPRSLLAGSLGLLVMAPLTVWQGTERLIRFWQGKRPAETRRIDHALAWMHRHAATADQSALVIVSVVVLLTGLRRDMPPVNLVLGEILCLGLVWGWWQAGKRLGDSVPVFLSMAAFFFGLLMVRNYLEIKGLWIPEYDLWAGLGLSSLACALDRVFARQPDYARRPLTVLHWGIPAVNTLWLLTHRLWGGDMALFLSALHSLQFGYLGRREKGSPYQAAAVFGAVVFCLLAFGTRLHLRQAYAYVVPIGFGTLALVHLFGERMQPADRNTVRSIALLAMLGSTVYYVIADSRLSLVHILVLGLLCLFCMGAAAFTRVRAYLYLGFTGFVVDLAALLYRVLIRLERGPRMTLVGVLVLGTGMALVAGSIYYKLHREQVRARLGKLGERLGNWE
ncbi:MAG: hypothetical protein RBU25_05400 [Lentisphaeria bacterium]|jgi:hypothetical protein|nr:hypothetical protein [Lentisphaeria bacterium]